MARLQTVLRRRKANGNGTTTTAPSASDGRLQLEDLVVSGTTLCLRCLGQTTELTSTELDLFYLLAREAGKVLHRDDILNQLRAHDAGLYTRAVDIVVSHLRKKLEPPDAMHKLRRRWHRRARHALGHSLRVRLLTLFLLLAVALAATFTYGMQKSLERGLARGRSPAGQQLCGPSRAGDLQAAQYRTSTSSDAAQPLMVRLQINPHADGHSVCITMRDHGAGVDEEALPHLTEPFYLPDSARGALPGGVGLGIYLFKLVAQAHGGRLQLHNAQPSRFSCA